MSRPSALLWSAMLALAACSAGQQPAPMAAAGPQSRSDAATMLACRSAADAAYDRQHRDTIYTINNRDTPFSAGNTGAGMTDRGLPQLYARDNMVRDCVRNTGTQSDRNTPAPAAEPTKPAKP